MKKRIRLIQSLNFRLPFLHSSYLFWICSLNFLCKKKNIIQNHLHSFQWFHLSQPKKQNGFFLYVILLVEIWILLSSISSSFRFSNFFVFLRSRLLLQPPVCSLVFPFFILFFFILFVLFLAEIVTETLFFSAVCLLLFSLLAIQSKEIVILQVFTYLFFSTIDSTLWKFNFFLK